VQVVTGATAGIGLEFADQLSAAGFKVLLISRDAKRLDLAAKEIRSFLSPVLSCTNALMRAEDKYKNETASHAFDFLNATTQDWEQLSAKLSPLHIGVLGPFISHRSSVLTLRRLVHMHSVCSTC